MKKYKLIRTYPGSVPLGSIVTENRKEGGFYRHTFINNDNERVYFSLFHSIVENHPEYWEKIEFFCKSEDEVDLFIGDKAFWVYKPTNNSTEYSLNPTPLIISHSSVKSASYGKWFFYEKEALQFIKTSNKQKLFTTTDGVDIYSDTNTGYTWNMIPYVNKVNGFIAKCELNSPVIKNFLNFKGTGIYKVFSTEEKAKEWVIENKKLNLTTKEIMNLFNVNQDVFYKNLVEKLGITR